MIMQWYTVKCVDNKLTEYWCSVMAGDIQSAKHIAIYRVYEEKHIRVKAVKAKLGYMYD